MPPSSATAPPHANRYLAHQRSITDLAGRVRALRIETFETATSEVLSGELRPKTTSLLEQANKLVHSVLDTYARPENDIEPASDDVFDQHDSDTEIARIADVAFMARVDLRQRAARVAALRDTRPIVFVTVCDGALRRVFKALGALDAAIARACRSKASSDFRSDIDLSLRVRACYGRFRAGVLADGEAIYRDDDVELRLRRACYEIALLMGSVIYPSFRIHDRIQFRSLQQRIVRWASTKPLDGPEGLFIWSDVCTFASILTEINRRQEIVEHDARIVVEALTFLEEEAVGDVPSLIVSSLLALEGRDDELDMLLASDVRDAFPWLTVLTRLAPEHSTFPVKAEGFQ